jgi:UDP-glucose 4-epimerase
MRVLITGGAGFIGSHLCDALVSRGEDVTILDNLSTGSQKNINHLEGKIKVVKGDIRDLHLVEALVKECDLLLHMAAALGVDNILENPIESISTNFYGSEITLNAALKFDKRVVIASTSEIYGKNLNQPLVESADRLIGSPQKLRWTYSDAKALEEAIAHFLFLTKQLKVTTIRFFNTVGPRQTGKYGMVIPRFVRSAILNEPIKIFGDGSQTRVFCHVSDAVRAILLLAESNTTIGEVFNLGGLQEISILDLASKIIEITNSNSQVIYKKYNEVYAPGFEDMQRRVPDLSKITDFIDWIPKLDLTHIIRDVYNYEIKGLSANQNQ